MNLITDMNKLKISGSFDRDTLQRANAALYNLKSKGYTTINIDLSELEKGYASDLLPFAARCRALIYDGVDTLLDLPSDRKFSRLFQNSNWAYLIDPRTFGPSEYVSSMHIPAVCYNNAESHFQAVD